MSNADRRKASSSHSGLEMERLELDRQLCFALYSASLATTRAYKPLLDPLGVTYPQYLVLLVLWQEDGLSISALGEKLMLDSGTLTPLLKRMEKQDLVKRERSPKDERRVHLRLTDRAWSLRESALEVQCQAVAATQCTPKELASLTARLRRLREDLHQTSIRVAL